MLPRLPPARLGPRSLPLLSVLTLSALLACTHGPSVETPDTRGSKNAGTTQGGGASTQESRSTSPFDSAGTTTPVGVVALDLGETRPCEQLCGRVGDCLLEGEDYQDNAAANLELECLDLCVHAPPTATARQQFLACESRDGCGPLTQCASDQWMALRGVRKGPEIASVDVAQDACRLGCTWLYHCLFTGAPPGEAELESGLQENLQTCKDQCDDVSPGEVEHLSKMYECLAGGQCSDPYACMR